mgnify:CR=1 FL=1
MKPYNKYPLLHPPPPSDWPGRCLFCWQPTELIWAFLFHKFFQFYSAPPTQHAAPIRLVTTVLLTPYADGARQRPMLERVLTNLWTGLLTANALWTALRASWQGLIARVGGFLAVVWMQRGTRSKETETVKGDFFLIQSWQIIFHPSAIRPLTPSPGYCSDHSSCQNCLSEPGCEWCNESELCTPQMWGRGGERGNSPIGLWEWSGMSTWNPWWWCCDMADIIAWILNADIWLILLLGFWMLTYGWYCSLDFECWHMADIAPRILNVDILETQHVWTVLWLCAQYHAR